MVLFNNCFVILFLTAYFLGMLYLNFPAIKDSKIEKKMNPLEVISAEYSLELAHTEKQHRAQVRTVFSQVPVLFCFLVTPLPISGITMTDLGRSHHILLSWIHVCQRIAQGKQIIMIKTRFIKKKKKNILFFCGKN